MVVYSVKIENKVVFLTSVRNAPNEMRVTGNKGDIVDFNLDNELYDLFAKGCALKATFIWRGKYVTSNIYTDSDGSIVCDVPPMYDTNEFRFGVYVGDDVEDDDYYATTTIAIPCQVSVRDWAKNPDDAMNEHFANRAEEAALRAETAATRTEELLNSYITEVDILIGGDS